MSKSILGLLFLLFLGIYLPASDAFGEDDLQRLLYIRQAANKTLAGNFLILDKISIDGETLQCRVYGTKRQVTAAASRVTKLPFYENSSPFMISQYAIYHFVKRSAFNPALQLARLDRTSALRATPIDQFAVESGKLQDLFKEIARDSDLDDDDRTDKIIEALENSPLFTLPDTAAADGDWLLAAALCEELANTLQSSPYRRALSNNDLRKTAKDLFGKCVEKLLSDLNTKLSSPNARRELFKKHFPRARSVWSESQVRDYANLRRIFYASLESYFRLDSISRIISPQDWGSAMLDVLLLTEGIPAALEIEQEFDAASRQWTKTQPTQPAGNK